MNHLTKNIITKGWLNGSIITKGFVLPSFKYTIVRKKGGSSVQGYGRENLYSDLKFIDPDEIKIIKVFVDWDKKVIKYNKKIYVELIKQKIEVELLEEYKKIKIKVNLIEK